MLVESGSTDVALRQFFGYRLKRVYNTISAELTQVLRPLELRITTYSALVLIVDQPGLRQSVIADLLEIQRSNMVALIDDLEFKGWVERQPVATDRRAFALFVSDSGKLVHDQAGVLVREHEAALLSCLTKQEQSVFVSLLGKVESSKGITG